MLSDANNSGDFCKVELKMLVLKIRMQLSEYGVEFNEKKFYSLMSANPSVECALSIVKCLIPLNRDKESEDSEEYEDCNDEDDHDNDDDLNDMFYMIEPHHSLSSLEIGPVRTSLRLSNERMKSSTQTTQRLSMTKRKSSKKFMQKSQTTQRLSMTKVQNSPSSSEEAPSPIKMRKRDKVRLKRGMLKSIFFIRGKN